MEHPQQTQPQTPLPAPQNTVHKVRLGWAVVALSIIVTLVGIYYGYALAASAIIAAFGGKLGLEAKHTALTATAFTITGLTLAFYLFTLLTN